MLEPRKIDQGLAVIIGALITGAITVAIALLQLSNNRTQLVIVTPSQAGASDPATPILSETEIAGTVQAGLEATLTAVAVAPTATPQATTGPAASTPTQAAEATAAEHGGLGLQPNLPVTQNADWEPLSREFEGVTMVLVPVGCFTMGAEQGPADAPAHEQCFDVPFWIDRTEVTRAMYVACLQAGACTEMPASEASTRDAQPINHVTWFQARDYCAWRDARLPTEREWEYAARGPDGLAYPWGSFFEAERVVFGLNSGLETAEAGSRPEGASWVGAVDMSGNVYEWTSTIYDENCADGACFPYPYADDGRERNSNEEVLRVLRGGSWYTGYEDGDYMAILSAYHRVQNWSTQESNLYGVRCARDFQPGDLSRPAETAR